MIADTLHKITTLEGRRPVYRDARIDVKTMRTEQLYPIAKYVLTDNLRRLIDLRGRVDIFDLTDVVDVDGVRISPPVVEWSDGRWCIVDGLHRCYLAHMARQPISVARVVGPQFNIPLISTPISWHEVQLVHEKPREARAMRNLRDGIENTDGTIRRYYRDLSVLGSTGRR